MDATESAYPLWLLLCPVGIAYPFGVRITSRCKSFHINAKVKSFLKIVSWNLLPSRRTENGERRESVENGSGSGWRAREEELWSSSSMGHLKQVLHLWLLCPFSAWHMYSASRRPSLISHSPTPWGHLLPVCLCVCVSSSPSLSFYVRVCDILFAWLWQLSLGFWVSFIVLRNWQRVVPFHSCCSRSRRRCRRLTLSTDLLDF